MSGSGTRWTYSDSAWFDSSVFNSSSDGNANYDIKTQAYSTLPFTLVHLAIGTISNYLIENTWASSSFLGLMQSGTVVSANTRSQWISWINNASGANYSWLNNCNQFGTNKAFNYQDFRIGAAFNGENDCLSVDEAVGFGIKGINAYSESIPSGAYSPYNGIGAKNLPAWILVK